MATIEKNKKYSISNAKSNKIYRDCVCIDIEENTYTFKTKTGEILIIDNFKFYSIW